MKEPAAEEMATEDGARQRNAERWAGTSAASAENPGLCGVDDCENQAMRQH